MDANTPVIVNAFPTPREQIVNYGIGLALTGVTLTVGFGTILLAGKLFEMRADRKAKKNQKNEK